MVSIFLIFNHSTTLKVLQFLRMSLSESHWPIFTLLKAKENGGLSVLRGVVIL